MLNEVNVACLLERVNVCQIEAAVCKDAHSLVPW
jgi:hypothetical protein